MNQSSKFKKFLRHAELFRKKGPRSWADTWKEFFSFILIFFRSEHWIWKSDRGFCDVGGIRSNGIFEVLCLIQEGYSFTLFLLDFLFFSRGKQAQTCEPLPAMIGSGVQRVRSSLGTGFSSISLMSPKCPKWHLTFRWDFNYVLLSVIISISNPASCSVHSHLTWGSNKNCQTMEV